MLAARTTRQQVIRINRVVTGGFEVHVIQLVEGATPLSPGLPGHDFLGAWLCGILAFKLAVSSNAAHESPNGRL